MKPFRWGAEKNEQLAEEQRIKAEAAAKKEAEQDAARQALAGFAPPEST